MPRVALYARVSTAEQTVDPQLDALREYARARGLEVVEEFVDQGVSGAKDRRPALDRLLKDARRRRFDLVACVKLDRLARSVRHLTTLAGSSTRSESDWWCWTKPSTRLRPRAGFCSTFLGPSRSLSGT